MNFSSLEYFTVLARERNFTRAAEQLHITQQTLSAHIAGLEKELGCPLLLRRTPLELTYAGSTFLRYAEKWLGLSIACAANSATSRKIKRVSCA